MISFQMPETKNPRQSGLKVVNLELIVDISYLFGYLFVLELLLAQDYMTSSRDQETKTLPNKLSR